MGLCQSRAICYVINIYLYSSLLLLFHLTFYYTFNSNFAVAKKELLDFHLRFKHVTVAFIVNDFRMNRATKLTPNRNYDVKKNPRFWETGKQHPVAMNTQLVGICPVLVTNILLYHTEAVYPHVMVETGFIYKTFWQTVPNIRRLLTHSGGTNVHFRHIVVQNNKIILKVMGTYKLF